MRPLIGFAVFCVAVSIGMFLMGVIIETYEDQEFIDYDVHAPNFGENTDV